jgi:hypothetical protein
MIDDREWKANEKYGDELVLLSNGHLEALDLREQLLIGRK